MKRFLFAIAAAVLCCRGAAAADDERVFWWGTDKEAATKLDKLDLVDLAVGLSKAPPPAKTSEIVYRLDIAVRAGLRGDAAAMIDTLAAKQPTMDK